VEPIFDQEWRPFTPRNHLEHESFDMMIELKIINSKLVRRMSINVLFLFSQVSVLSFKIIFSFF